MHEDKIKLKSLLEKLDLYDEDLPEEVIDLIYSYLFEDGNIPFFVNTNLFQSVMYLKDIGKDNIAELLKYYEDKKIKLREFLKQFSHDKDTEG